MLSHPLVSAINQKLSEKPNTPLEELKELILEKANDLFFTDKAALTDALKVLYFVFLRENVTGPSIYTEYVEETKAPLVKGGPLPERPVDAMSNKNQELQEQLLKHFERDSE